MNILIVVEKTYVKNVILEILQEHPNEFKDNYFFTLSNYITHENDDCLRIRCVKGEYFQHRSKLDNVTPLKLNDLTIPEHTYLEFHRESLSEEMDLNKIDKVIGFFDKDENGMLGFQKYIEDNNLNNTFIYPILILNKEHIYEGLLKPLPFDEVWEKTKEFLINKNFQASYPRKCDVYKLRKDVNMSRKEFATYFNIPYRTVENWEFDLNLCPKYLFDLMKYKLENEHLL